MSISSGFVAEHDRRTQLIAYLDARRDKSEMLTVLHQAGRRRMLAARGYCRVIKKNGQQCRGIALQETGGYCAKHRPTTSP